MDSIFINEFKDAFISKDYSLLTRRFLDACKEYEVPNELHKKTIALRKKYLTFLDGLSEPITQDEAQELITEFTTSNFNPKISSDFGNTVVQANEITKQFTSGNSPFKLHELSLNLMLGEITGVVGENGNGKTTLLNLIAGIISTSSGQINYPSLNKNNLDYYKTKQQIAFIPQRIDKWYGTLMQNLQFFCAIHNIKANNIDDEIEYILCRLGLDKFRHLTWNEISSGYRLRFELAKMLLWRPQLLVLDEPLANLDINAQQLLLQDLKFFVKSKAYPLSIILSSQNLHEVERVADNLVFIRQGKTIFNGKQNQIGEQNQNNQFEVSGNFTLKDLKNIFTNAKVEDTGTTFIITIDKNTSWFDVLSNLNKNNLQLKYYRDITNSTRLLFHKDI
ncbi:MAG: ATP-binding cassette domain-containing protein [Bacteroidetes bacterium]|nr:ATP-binding cassette domain-containing protein [Bacteroidota bacterium]